jgi:hypothetical protein
MHIIFQFALSEPERLSPPPIEAEPANQVDLSGAGSQFARGISHVIIKKEFSGLEPTLRRFFYDLPNVSIFVDRRWHARRAPASPPDGTPVPDRRNRRDRRQAVSAFEVLVPLAHGMLP